MFLRVDPIVQWQRAKVHICGDGIHEMRSKNGVTAEVEIVTRIIRCILHHSKCLQCRHVDVWLRESSIGEPSTFPPANLGFCPNRLDPSPPPPKLGHQKLFVF